MGSKSLIELAKQGRSALSKWRQANPDALLNLSEADLRKVNLRGANLKRADLTGANLRGADLIGAQFTEAELTRADLREAKLVKADFYAAELYMATLAGADCSGAYFRRAQMKQCDLSRADLTKADLMEVNLTKGILVQAILVGADLTRATLHEADLSHATVGWTSLCSLDLTRTVGIDRLRHIGPSILGLDTAMRSHQRLDPDFLYGCGISEGVIQQWKSLFGHPFERVACFIRFAPEDATFAKSIYQSAQSKGLRCWLDEMPAINVERRPHVDPTGYDYDERVLLCASKAALTSWWITDELERVFSREKQIKADTGRDVRLLFPLNLDGFMFSGDWKHKQEKLMTRLAIDFVGWRRNNEKLEQQMAKLLPLVTGEKR